MAKNYDKELMDEYSEYLDNNPYISYSVWLEIRVVFWRRTTFITWLIIAIFLLVAYG